MTDIELEALKALCNAATPGPWIDPPGRGGSDNGPYLSTPAGRHIGRFDYADNHPNDKHFIAAAREAVPKLIAEIERLRTAAAALLDLANAISDTELHGDGAHDEHCDVCRAYKNARAVLASLPVRRGKEEEGSLPSPSAQSPKA